MTKTSAIAAGALALGLLAHAPAQAGTASAGAFSAPMVTIEAGNLMQNVTYGYRVPIRRILRKLRHQGYSNIGQVEQLRHAYLVNAHNWRGKPVRIKVSARSGKIIWVKQIRQYDGGGQYGGGQYGAGLPPYGGGRRHGGPRRWGY